MKKPLIRRFGMSLLRIFLLLALILVGCQGKLIYFPQRYTDDEVAEFKDHFVRPLEFTTDQGKQTAWYQAAADGARPERLWLVCAGNGSRALDLHGESAATLRQDAFVFVDYPGYGVCEGTPRPARIRENLRQAWTLAVKEAGFTEAEAKEKGRFFGHSLGAAAALIAADDAGLSRGVLIAPFTSTMDMAQAMLKLPLGFLVWHRFDNHARLESVCARPNARVDLVHGAEDEVIPVRMGRELSAAQPQAIHYHEVPGGRHNDIFGQAPQVIRAALKAAR